MTTTPFTIIYTGRPFQLDETRIGAVSTLDGTPIQDPDWSVPIFDQFYDVSTNRLPELIDLALQTGAIVVPDGLSLTVYSDEDSEGVGFYIMVSGAPPETQYLTTGWNNIREIALDPNSRHHGESAKASDEDPTLAPDTIAHALAYVVACANQALGARAEP